MQIAFGSDNHYAQHLAVTLASLLTNLKPGIEPHVHVVTDGFSETNRQKIAMLKSIRPFTIDYLTVSGDDFKNFPNQWAHVSYATYFRLKLPELLPQVDKIVYLDIDTVVTGDVAPLWDIVLTDDEWIAGALELEVGTDFLQTIGLPPDEPYVNAGIMVMNLDALRRNQFEQRCATFIADYHHVIKYVDQDVINHVCQGHKKIIDPRYNMVFSRYYHAHRLDRYHSVYSTETLQQALQQPVVIHFSGGYKPWLYACRHNLASLYMDYIKLTPWRAYRYPDRTLKTIASKNMFILRQWLKHGKAWRALDKAAR
jgi:lipopolysaccharide biosynthesis glycosyltransferase